MAESFADKEVWIVGKGISGEGAHAALTSRGARCRYVESDIDTAASRPDLIIVSPGIPTNTPVFTYAARRDVPIYGELELGYRMCAAPIVCVTGTNGKTTVTEWIGDVLRRAGKRVAVCGNIGVSFARTAAEGGFDIAVVEASSFQLETTLAFRPHIAVWTNFSPDHLNRHGTMEAYMAAKRKITEKQTEEDFLVLSADDVSLYALASLHTRAKVLYTSLRAKVHGTYICGDTIYHDGNALCNVDRVRAEGKHNLANALSVVCVAALLGVEDNVIIDALTDFRPRAHRMQPVARYGGKNYYDDSKGTNIMATVRAAESMAGDTVLLVGGSDKGYEYDDLFRQLPPCVVRVAAFGAVAEKTAAAAKRCGYVQIRTFDDLSSAFRWANDGKEENVLLSPASASFDAYASYAERGDDFCRLVHLYAEEN